MLAPGKTEVSLRLYCRVRLATSYRLPLVEKLSPRLWPNPNSATSQGAPPSLPHVLLAASTVVVLGKEVWTVL